MKNKKKATHIDETIDDLLDQLVDQDAGSEAQNNIADSIEKLMRGDSYKAHVDPVAIATIGAQLVTVIGILWVEGHGDIISAKAFPLVNKFSKNRF